MSTKKALYVIFFSCGGITIQEVLVPKGKRTCVTGWLYRDVLKSLRKMLFSDRLHHVLLLYDIVPAHTSEIVKGFLK